MSLRPIRVAVLTFSYPRFRDDEASVFVERLVKAFEKVGLTGLVVTPRDSVEPPFEQQGVFQVHRIRYTLVKKGALAYGSGIMRNIKNNPLVTLQIPGLLFALTCRLFLLRGNFDLVQANWVVSAIPASLLKLLSKKPFCVTVRGEDMELLKNKAIRVLLTPFVNQAAALVTVSDGFGKMAGEYFPKLRGKIVTIPNGVHVGRCTPEQIKRARDKYRLSDREQYLLYVGRIIPLKRVELLFELLNIPCFLQMHLLLAGRIDGPYEEELKRILSHMGLSERVRFLDAVAPSDVATLLSLSRFYVSASAREGRPNSILEALAAGRPVIASDIPAHRELINSGVNGFLFSPDALDQLASQLDELDHEYPRLSAEASQSVKGLSWENTGSSYRRLFEEILV